MPWAGFFATSVWLLWKNRCTTTFKGLSPSLTHSIIAKAKLWYAAWTAPDSELGNQRRQGTRITASIGWTFPPEGWMTLNVDGASCGNPVPAGAGGLIRDSTGRWRAGFVANIGSASAALTEIWALFYGLELAWKEGHRAIIVQSDSQLVIQLVEDRQDPVHPYATLLAAIRRQVSRDWLVRITHTYR
ncbi:unnamed protein product [Linum trigynum]|uniref:RNase H type-1 domain-containing protein n=1 Tax=Linum trigynum TaxID=586398 RepID=A0AAV2G1K8_9ROSI